MRGTEIGTFWIARKEERKETTDFGAPCDSL